MAAVSKLVSGFECEFVEKPPEAFQTECLICLLVLREPYQVICCGKSFCRSCIERVKALNNPCPHCNHRNFNDFPNKGLQQSLYQYDVQCTHQKKGCKWTGELGALDNHLNVDHQPANQLEGCVFVMVKCIHCSKSHRRKFIKQHQNYRCPKRPLSCKHCKVYKSTFEDVTKKHNKVCPKRPFTCKYCKIYKSTFEDVATNHHKVCPKRPFTCEYCNDYKSTFEDVTTNHWPVCENYPVDCPNKCGAAIQRQNLKSHEAKDCPLTVIDCDFHNAGCEVRLPRKDMGEHLRVELGKHTSMMAVSYQQQKIKYMYQSQKEQHQYQMVELMMKQLLILGEENEALKKRVTEQDKQIEVLQMKTNLPPVDIIMTNFEQYKEKNDYWYSPPFYTHHGGYKLCLQCIANGSMFLWRTVSVYFYMMRGEFDDELKWPFRGEVTLQLLRQDGTNRHRTKTIMLDNTSYYSRVTKGERGGNGLGTFNIISHDDCYKGYIKDDTLHFRIGIKLC